MATWWCASSTADFFQAQLAPITTPATLAPRVKEGVTGGTPSTETFGRAKLPGALTDFWFGVTWQLPSTNRQVYWDFFDTAFSSTNPVVRFVRATTTTLWSLQVWNGTAMVTLATSSIGDINSATPSRWDMRFVKSDTVGIVEIYKDGISVANVTGLDTNRVTWTKIDLMALTFTNGSGPSVSGMVYSSEDTRGVEVFQANITGNGAETAWTGAFTDVDESGLTTTDFISSGVSNATETFTVTWDAALNASYSVKAGVMSAHGRQSIVGAPISVKGIYNIGAVNYEIGSAPLVAAADIAFTFVSELNPATSAAWVTADFTAAQVGVRRT